MSDNTLQFEWIAKIKGGLDAVFADDPNVFVAGDLLWYPVLGSPRIRIGPDVLVAVGRPRGYRGSYKQWEEGGAAPQVVFEILSPNNTPAEMHAKRLFYEQYGVEEYYLYDPEEGRLTAYQRAGAHLQEIANPHGWVSPRLGIRFDLSSSELRIFGPDGRLFLSAAELATQRNDAERAADQAKLDADQAKLDAEQAKLAADQAKLDAEQAKLAADQAKLAADQAKLDADQAKCDANEAKRKADRLRDQLRALGVEPEE